ncbi:MAG: DNA methyltransferase [Sandaracinus sp.]|nr:DNA methyltransferase [Sandaracinus sp.]
MVEDQLTDLPVGTRVLDPFSGTGTTALAAAERGHQATGVELNPFLVWLARLKTRRFSPRTIERTRDAANEALAGLADADPVEPPPIHNIDRWWAPPVRDWLCRLRAGLPARGAAADLLEVAFCRTMIALSGAAFDHPSMSFGEARAHTDAQARERFAADVEHVLAGAAVAPTGEARIVHGDARELPLGDARFDAVITSPPYPNRMSYVRELRPYMYWTGHLEVARDAGELDWQAIGGTWGVATSRLKGWARQRRRPRGLRPVLERIRAASPKNGELLAAYVDRYFEDIDRHLEALRPLVAPGGSLAYVIGNASFYGELVPAETLFEALMRRHGFRDARSTILRKRNSKKELYELLVTARAPG